MERGDRLVEHVAAGGNGPTANELLGEFFRGYPLERLRELLRSSDERVARVGAFIASELGDRFAPLLDEVPRMLEHPIRAVRFDALDAVLVNATSEHGEMIAKAILLVRDPEKGVRSQARRFLARATVEQLSASLPYFADTSVAALARWLLKSASSETDSREVLARLDADDGLTRMFASAAAARLAAHDIVPLEHAAASADPEVRSFAQQELEVLKERG